MSIKSILFSRIAALGLIGGLLVVTLMFQINGMQQHKPAPEPALPAKLAPTTSGGIMAEGRLVTYPGAEVALASEVDGVLQQIHVKEKQQVTQGQLLAQIASGELEASRAQAQAKRAETDVDIRMYTREVTRAQQLVDAKFISPQMRDKKQYDLDAARSRRSTAAAEIRRIDALLAKNRIHSPINGTVLVRTAHPGETVTRGTSILTIADLTRVCVEAEVDEFDAKNVHVGDEVKITAEGYDGTEWRGHVEEIPVNVVPRGLLPQDTARPTDTRVLLVKIALDETLPLKLGQRLEAHFSQRRDTGKASFSPYQKAASLKMSAFSK